MVSKKHGLSRENKLFAALYYTLATAFPKMAGCTTDFIYALTIGSIKRWP